MVIIRLYDFLRCHPVIRWASLVGVTLVMLASILSLSYKEDIQDFLPLSEADRGRMAVYQDISGMDRLFVIFENPQPPLGGVEQTTQAIECFVEAVEESDTAGWCRGMQATFDSESLSETMDFIYENIPLFLEEEDYKRMDSLLASPGFIDGKLEDDLNALTLPLGSIVSQSIGRDPLGLFSAPLEELRQSQSQFRFEICDGCLFTPDMSRAIVMLSSPFGSSETRKNARLVSLLEDAIGRMQADFPEVKAHVTGGPQIAVGNARQIMHDSILSVSLAAVLVMALLLYAFRRIRDIALIALTVLWGWLFALAGMTLTHDSVSMIVVGMSSVIIGIAVNYPLHLAGHVRHQTDMRQALREITKPLLVGNVTTIAAFLALVPLRSACLRDLGLFAAFLLIGTMLFVLVWLPQMVEGQESREAHIPLQTLRASVAYAPQSLRCQRAIAPRGGFRSLPLGGDGGGPWRGPLVWLIAVPTLVLGYFSFSVEFDPDVSHINYMTEEQRADMETLSNSPLGRAEEHVSLYLLSSAASFDDALILSETRQGIIDSLKADGLVVGHRGAGRFLPSRGEQARRIARWNEWLARHLRLCDDLDAAAAKHGFSDNAFTDFKDIIEAEYAALPFDAFLPLTSGVLTGCTSSAIEGQSTVAEVITVRKEDAERVKATLPNAFDIASMHASVAETLSDDFNYIGWVCSSVVFLFLWLSFRDFGLAVISFIPMAVSWIWILGIMALLGIKFNIVNIILASFIFGQGDDYTIFMTEGCVSEHVRKQPVLASYKRSIILSALIMFAGIGSLIFAKHPALHSLAEVTIIGMSSVVLMAYLLPPLLYKYIKKTPSNSPVRGRIK